MREGFEKYKNLFIVLICVAIICIISNVIAFISSLIYLGFHIIIAFPFIMSILLYVSVIKHTIKFFFICKESNITSMLMRFCGTIAAFLIGLNDSHPIIVAMIAIILILVPFMAGDLTQVKRDTIIIFVVMLLSIALDLGKIILIPQAVLPYENHNLLDSIIYYIFAFNQVLQWSMFSIVYLIRAKHYVKYLKGNEITTKGTISE